MPSGGLSVDEVQFQLSDQIMARILLEPTRSWRKVWLLWIITKIQTAFVQDNIKWTNDSLKWTKWPRLPLSFTSFVVVRWGAADSRRWFASRSLTVIDSRTETSWLPRASQMHAVFVFSVSCQINETFECLVNLSRSFMARSHARDPAGRDPHLGGSWSWMGVANGHLLNSK